MSSHPGFGAHTDPTFKSRPRPTGEVVRRVGVYLKPYWVMAFGTVTCAILSLGFGLLYPKLTRTIIDTVINQSREDLLLPAAWGLIGAFLFRELFNSLRILINNHLEQNVIFDMRRDVFARLQRLPVPWFDQRASGDLMTRVIEDVNNVERMLIDGVEQGTVALLSIVGALVFMVIYSPMLAAVSLIPIPFLIAGALWYTLTAHRRYRKQREAASAMNALLMDNLQGIRQIKAFGRQEHEDQRFAGRADDLRQGTLIVMRAWAAYGPAMQFVGALGIGLVLAVGGHEVLRGRMEVGQLVAFMLYAGMFFYEPIGRLHGLNQMVQAARAAAARVFDILDADEERADRTELLKRPVRGAVDYQDVEFSYGEGQTVLNRIQLHAEPGQMIALVGPTGAGKSTLVNLLPAFYEPTHGRISIDGQDLRTITLGSLRDQISVVSQEAFLFNGSIRENIGYGRLEASEEEMMAAARAANCHDFIVKLPNGYDSHVGERGIKLSVGEKQRVSIARALLKNAPILILDEATASVDTATERLIQEALERLMAGRTSFVIAHRLSTIVKADQILVLLHGEIVERGTHEELLARDGLYAKLARIQNTTFIEESFERLALP
ncbi:MAG: ABC transporter ATP-binding protein/permease [Verrucomicrobia bacterium]|jgi:ABC-type multidrug transport system fused ATPase/permease subunit|nr:ABC transporter ATP-binding protein/permease [Verrucomicrobiota bacterium]